MGDKVIRKSKSCFFRQIAADFTKNNDENFFDLLIHKVSIDRNINAPILNPSKFHFLNRGQPAKEKMSAQRTEPRFLSISNETGAIPKKPRRSNDLTEKFNMSESDSTVLVLPEEVLCKIFRYLNKKLTKKTDKLIDKQRDKQTNRQNDRQTNKQTNKQTKKLKTNQ